MKKIVITGKQLDNIPEGEEQMQYITTMTKALDAWADLNKERGFIIIACGESNKKITVLRLSSSPMRYQTHL